MQAINARVELIDSRFELPDETKIYMGVVRKAIAEAARTIRDALPQQYDVGRVIAAMDKLQESKDTFCVAGILPHAPKK